MNSERAVDRFIIALDSKKAKILTEREEEYVDTLWKKLTEEKEESK